MFRHMQRNSTADHKLTNGEYDYVVFNRKRALVNIALIKQRDSGQRHKLGVLSEPNNPDNVALLELKLRLNETLPWI